MKMDVGKKTAGETASKKTATEVPGKKTAEEQERLKKLAAKKTGASQEVRAGKQGVVKGGKFRAVSPANVKSIDNPYGKKS